MSSTAAEDDTVVAPRVGADLSAARQRLGWSLEDLAAGLRIRLPFLIALEEGRIADLPGNAYALGFLRTYAVSLGLDPEELTRRFRAEAAEVNRRTELNFPVPVPSKGVPAGAVVLLGVLLAIGAYVGWYRLSGDGELPPEVVPPVPAQLAPLAERAVPPAGSSAPGSAAAGSAMASSAAGGVAPSGPSSVAPVASPVWMPAAAATAPSTSAAVAALSPAMGQTDSTTASIPAQAAVPTEPSVPPTQAAAATTSSMTQMDRPRIVLSASADAWLQVRDKSGQVLLNRVLHPGEFWQVPVQPNLVLTTGNAGGTDILVDGGSTPSLGASGAVRRDIPLDPDLLKAGKLPSASLPFATASYGAPVSPRSEQQ